MDQPGKNVNPACCQLDRENKYRLINRVRMPILLVVSWTGEINMYLSPFAPENLVSRDKFGGPVLILHTQAESGARSRDSSRFPRRRPFIYTANRDRVSSKFIRSRNCVAPAFTAESPPARGQ